MRNKLRIHFKTLVVAFSLTFLPLLREIMQSNTWKQFDDVDLFFMSEHISMQS